MTTRRLNLGRCLARLTLHALRHYDRGRDLDDAVFEGTADLLDDIAVRLDPEDGHDIHRIAQRIRTTNDDADFGHRDRPDRPS